MKTDAFLTRVHDICQLPDSDEDWSDAQILIEATQALYNRFTQPMQVLRAGYWLKRITSTTISGTNFYRMPARAIVQGLEKIEVSTDNGVKWRALSILTDAETCDYSDVGSGEPNWFSLEGDGVVLYPTPSGPFLLRMSYYLRPNQLVPANAGGVVFAIAPTSITVSGDPTSFLFPPGTMDVVNSDGCGEVAVVDMPFSAVTSLGANLWSVTIASGTDTSRMAVGQLLRASDTTDVIPLPQELQSALVEWTAATILAEKGDIEKAGVFSSKADNTVKRVIDMATPRIKSRPYVWRTRNSFLRKRVSGGAWR